MKSSDLQTLARCEVFAGVAGSDIRDIADRFGLKADIYAKREVIFSPEQYSNSLAVILKGRAEVYKQTEKGLLLLSILEKGAVFGMAAMFYEENGFVNTVCAREDCRVVFISRGQLEKIFEACPVCAVNYITVLSKKVHYLNEKILYLTSPAPSDRLLSWLINESERQSTDEITLPVSCSELALALSLGRTSLYRAFDELAVRGSLVRNGRKIKLLGLK